MKGRTSNFVRTLAACVLAAGCATSGWPPESAGSPAGAPGTADLRRIEAIADSMAQAQIVTGRVPGMSIAVARDGQILFARGYGQADLEAGTAAHPNTVYDVGSIPKQFAAAALMRLAAQDRVSLDAPLTDYLPDFPVQDHLVTVRHLLNHTSGIAERSGRPVRDDVHSQWYRLDLSYREMMELWGDRPFVFRPGERYAYNNFGYYVLGEIISRAAGKPFHEHAERELLHPLGLDRTVHCDHRRIIPDRARGYELEDGRLVNARFVSLSLPGAAGGFCSTVGDLARWTHLLHAGEVVGQSALREMTAPTVLETSDTVGYGYGLYVEELAGHRKIYHGGASAGFGSYLSHYPEQALTIVVLNNAPGGRELAAGVERAIARAVLDAEIRDLPLSDPEIARYQGTYLLTTGSRSTQLRVFSDDGRLWAQIGRGQPTRLLAQGDHTFIPAASDEVSYEFVVEDGRAVRLTQRIGRWRRIEGERIP